MTGYGTRNLSAAGWHGVSENRITLTAPKSLANRGVLTQFAPIGQCNSHVPTMTASQNSGTIQGPAGHPAG